MTRVRELVTLSVTSMTAQRCPMHMTVAYSKFDQICDDSRHENCIPASQNSVVQLQAAGSHDDEIQNEGYEWHKECCQRHGPCWHCVVLQRVAVPPQFLCCEQHTQCAIVESPKQRRDTMEPPGTRTLHFMHASMHFRMH